MSNKGLQQLVWKFDFEGLVLADVEQADLHVCTTSLFAQLGFVVCLHNWVL
jgi:hypothetical protein